MDRHIFLVGMPGSGKSALGRRVALKLGVPYLDTDVYLTEKTGYDTAQLYEKFGEQAFRDGETRLLENLATETPGIISTGGGVCMREYNRELMHNHGIVVLIQRPVDDIMINVRAEKRPYIAQGGIGVLEKLYEDRMPIYEAVADVTMDNSNGFYNGLSELEKIVSAYIG